MTIDFANPSPAVVDAIAGALWDAEEDLNEAWRCGLSFAESQRLRAEGWGGRHEWPAYREADEAKPFFMRAQHMCRSLARLQAKGGLG